MSETILTAYKVLVDGKSCHGGNMEWSLPVAIDGTEDYTPGEWMEVKGNIVCCQTGLHLTNKPAEWWVQGATVYLTEYDLSKLSKYNTDNRNKFAVHRARLLKPLNQNESATVKIFTGDARGVVSGEAAISSGNATVRASGNATVRASDNATVEAYDNATVRDYDNATVEAYGNSTVEASGNATVRASGNATVRASGNATVRASGNATVRASDNATVEAYDNATVRASDNATVRASDNATVNILWGSPTVTGSKNAVVISRLSNAITVSVGGVVYAPAPIQEVSE